MILLFLYPRKSPFILGNDFFGRGYAGIYGDEKQKYGNQKCHPSHGCTPCSSPARSIGGLAFVVIQLFDHSA